MTSVFILATAFLLIDQFSKVLVLDYLTPGKAIPIIPHALYFTRVHNTGVAFGLFRENNLLSILLVIFGCLLLFLLLYNTKVDGTIQKIACALIIAGALGNIIDRIRFGAVIDFIDVQFWPVFNIADMCISIAAGLFVIALLKKRK